MLSWSWLASVCPSKTTSLVTIGGVIQNTASHPAISITILQSVSRGLISDICVASHYCVTVTITAIHLNIVIITEVFSHKHT